MLRETVLGLCFSVELRRDDEDLGSICTWMFFGSPDWNSRLTPSLEGPLTLQGRDQPPGLAIAQADYSSVPRGMAGIGLCCSGHEWRSRTQEGMEAENLFPQGRRSQGGRCHSQQSLGPPPVQRGRRKRNCPVRIGALTHTPQLELKARVTTGCFKSHCIFLCFLFY